MKIKVNGKAQFIDTHQVSVLELLKRENVENPEMVSIQLNGEFVNKERLGATYLKDADEVDFLYFMGGGSITIGWRQKE